MFVIVSTTKSIMFKLESTLIFDRVSLKPREEKKIEKNTVKMVYLRMRAYVDAKGFLSTK